jgi:hypothetical protein
MCDAVRDVAVLIGGFDVTNPIPRKSATPIVARIAVILGVLLLATVTWQQLAEPNAVRAEASQANQYGYRVYSGEDLWHALLIGR